MSGLWSLNTPTTSYWSVKIIIDSVSDFMVHTCSTKYPNWPDAEIVQAVLAQLSNRLLGNYLGLNNCAALPSIEQIESTPTEEDAQ